MSVTREQIASLLEKTLVTTDLDWGSKYEGKVRDNYTAGSRRLIVVTDRISAFDHILGTIPLKGQVLNQLAKFWFEQTRDIAPNHLEAVIDPAAMMVKECVPLKAEFVMRSYLTGTTSTSIWRAYESGSRSFCGHALPEGMERHQKLPKPILTPTSKASHGDHDQNMSKEDILAQRLVSADHFAAAEKLAHQLFAFGQRYAAERGLILVDTKYEFGVWNDQVIVVDEIHTPDSSRYWFTSDYDERMAKGEDPRPIDKDFIRRWMVAEHNYRGDGPPPPLSDDVRIDAALRYIENFELITGRAFVPDLSEPSERLDHNLSHYLSSQEKS